MEVDAVLGREFLSWAYRHPGQVRELAGALRPDDFADALQGALWQAFLHLELARGTQGAPEVTPALLANEAARALAGQDAATRQAALSRLDALVEQVRKLRGGPRVCEVVLERAARARMSEAVEHAREALLAGDDPEQVFERVCLEGRSALCARKARPPVAASERLEEMRLAGDAAVEGVTTGLAPLDALLHAGAGLGRGELGIFVGAPKGGKTLHLVHVAVAAAHAGAATYYFSLELRSGAVLERVLASVLGARIAEVGELVMRDGLAEKLGQMRHVLDRLFVVDLPTGEATVRELARVLRSGAQRPGLVVVDYGDLMKSGLRAADTEFAAQTAIFRGLRALACEFAVPVWTATRCTREAISRAWIRMQDIATSIEKASIADVVVAICQTDDEVRRGRERLFVAGSRIGPDGRTVAVQVDRSRNLLTGARLLGAVDDGQR